jgi:hypothetical protein
MAEDVLSVLQVDEVICYKAHTKYKLWGRGLRRAEHVPA